MRSVSTGTARRPTGISKRTGASVRRGTGSVAESADQGGPSHKPWPRPASRPSGEARHGDTEHAARGLRRGRGRWEFAGEIPAERPPGPGPMIEHDAILAPHRPDLVPPLSAADPFASIRVARRMRRRDALGGQAIDQPLAGEEAIPVLAPMHFAPDEHPGGAVAQLDGRLGLVAVLAAGTGPHRRGVLEILIAHESGRGRRQRQHRDGYRASMDPAAFFGGRHPLPPMAAGLGRQNAPGPGA